MTDSRRHTLAAEFLQRRKRRAASVARLTARDRKAGELFRQAYASGVLALELMQSARFSTAWRSRSRPAARME
jgi:hypothetical protein